MTTYPYRVKRIRCQSSVLVDNERETIDESHHRCILWRVSDTEFRAVRHVPQNEPRMASIDAFYDRNRITAIFMPQIREVLLYAKGETMPWPEVTSPPDAVDDAVLMRTAPATSAKKAER